MRYRALVAFPLLWGVAFIIGYNLFVNTPGFPVFMRTEVELVKAFGLIGSWTAAFAFHRGDYLRKAWFLIGACFAFLLLRDLTVIVPGPFQPLGPVGIDILRGILVVAGNIAQVIGTWILARAWKVASISLPGTSRGQWLVLAVVVALSIAFAGPAVVTSTQRVMNGELGAISGAASALGDTFGLCLIAPLLLTAVALRGGALAGPWALLTSANLGWLCYDAALVLGPFLGLSTVGVRGTSEFFRALACLLGFSAGLAQKAVVDRLRGLAAEPPTSSSSPAA
jgi:hypothetical protein